MHTFPHCNTTTCCAFLPSPVLLIHREPVIHPRHGEVHRDLQGLVLVRHLAHLPDREGKVEVHVGCLVICV